MPHVAPCRAKLRRFSLRCVSQCSLFFAVLFIAVLSSQCSCPASHCCLRSAFCAVSQCFCSASQCFCSAPLHSAFLRRTFLRRTFFAASLCSVSCTAFHAGFHAGTASACSVSAFSAAARSLEFRAFSGSLFQRGNRKSCSFSAETASHAPSVLFLRFFFFGFSLKPALQTAALSTVLRCNNDKFNHVDITRVNMIR